MATATVPRSWSVFDRYCPTTGADCTLVGETLLFLISADGANHYGPYRADDWESLIARWYHPARARGCVLVAPGWMTTEGTPAYFIDQWQAVKAPWFRDRGGRYSFSKPIDG